MYTITKSQRTGQIVNYQGKSYNITSKKRKIKFVDEVDDVEELEGMDENAGYIPVVLQCIKCREIGYCKENDQGELYYFEPPSNVPIFVLYNFSSSDLYICLYSSSL